VAKRSSASRLAHGSLVTLNVSGWLNLPRDGGVLATGYGRSCELLSLRPVCSALLSRLLLAATVAMSLSQQALQRRTALSLALSSLAWPAAAAPPQALRLFQSRSKPAAQPSVQPAFTRALVASIDDAREAQTQLSALSLAQETRRLERQEWPFYAAANSLPRSLPPESDEQWLASPALLNFRLYTTFKSLGKSLDNASRDAFTSALGACLLRRLLPQRTSGSLQTELTALLDALIAGGYARSYVLTLGTVSPGLPELPGETASHASRVVVQPGWADGATGAVQVRLNAPMDIAGGVALRAEEDGWWGRPVPALLSALLGELGCGAPATESFFQDEWQSPDGLQARLLLALGDPLGIVDVPFVPDTLVLDWELPSRSA